MKLAITAFIFWIASMSALLALELESFKLVFFGIMLTIAILMVFVIKAFLTSGSDS